MAAPLTDADLFSFDEAQSTPTPPTPKPGMDSFLAQAAEQVGLKDQPSQEAMEVEAADNDAANNDAANHAAAVAKTSANRRRGSSARSPVPSAIRHLLHDHCRRPPTALVLELSLQLCIARRHQHARVSLNREERRALNAGHGTAAIWPRFFGCFVTRLRPAPGMCTFHLHFRPFFLHPFSLRNSYFVVIRFIYCITIRIAEYSVL